MKNCNVLNIFKNNIKYTLTLKATVKLKEVKLYLHTQLARDKF